MGVAAQVREPGLRDLHLHAGERPGTLLDLEVLGRPGADPGDLEVAARGHAERIVEQNGVGLALGVTVVRRAEREHRPEGRERPTAIEAARFTGPPTSATRRIRAWRARRRKARWSRPQPVPRSRQGSGGTAGASDRVRKGSRTG